MGVLDNIHVVPDYSTNAELADRIRRRLAEYVDVTTYDGIRPPPKIIIFRPAGRPGDEFGEAVAPLLNYEGSIPLVYLVVAFSGRSKDISELVPYSQRDRVRIIESIFIQFGQLVSEESQNFMANQKAFERVATEICQDYHLQKRCIPEPSTTVSKAKSMGLGRFFKAGGSKSPAQTAQDDDSSFTFIQDDAKLLVTAFRIIEDFPQGVTLDDICRIMQLRDRERTHMCNIFDLNQSVFTTNIHSGKKFWKFAKSFEEEISRIKSSDEYIHYLKTYNIGDLPPDETYRRIKELQQTGDLDKTILSRVDQHFKLNGKLSEILKMVFELSTGNSHQEMNTMDQGDAPLNYTSREFPGMQINGSTESGKGKE